MATVTPKFWGTTSVVAAEGDYDAVAMLPNGGYVVAWRDTGQITFQIYNGNGDKVGSTHTTTAPINGTVSQWQPDILTKSDGSFVITWTEGTGVSTGGQILRSQTFNMHGQSTVAAVQLSQGLKYTSIHATTNGADGQITGYVKDVSGNAKLTVIETIGTVSTETVINSVQLDNTNPPTNLTVASGEVDIDWLGNNLGYAVAIPINGNGLAIGILKNGAVKTFDALIANTVDYDVVALKTGGAPNGRFVVTYSDLTTNQVKVDTFHFDAIANEIVRDTSVALDPRTTDSAGTKTSITALHDGGYAVAYKGQGTAASDIFVKTFDATGVLISTSQIPVNGQQHTPAVFEMADGRLAVTWADPSLNNGAIETVIIDARSDRMTVVGTGDNDIYAPSAHAGDNFNGSGGFDTLTFKESTAGVAANLVAGNGSAGDAAGDTYTNFEKIIGSNFNDTLEGGAGHVLVGGAGNDTYIVSATNTVIDESGGGYDQVYSTVTYTLSAGIENLFASGENPIDLTGNESNNLIVGNGVGNRLVGAGGDDTLNGAGGDDALDGGAGTDALNGGTGNDALSGGDGDDGLQGADGNDSLNGGAGNDNLMGGTGNDALAGGIGNDYLYSGDGNDVLDGGDGDDLIDGGTGADVMNGGAGNDVYFIDDINDQVIDGAGVDTAVVFVNYNIASLGSVENIIGRGAASITFTGNAASNNMTGSDGANIMIGGAGNDVLDGGLGNDRVHGQEGNDILIGGLGRDIFVFDKKPNKRTNVDKILDFNVRDDSIYVENKYFKVGTGSLSKPKQMADKYFYKGTKAHDKDDRFIYDKKGVLYYDADGTGSSAQVKIATLSKNLKMTYKDFFVI